MTVQEIYKEVFEDFDTLEKKIDTCKHNFERFVLKSSRYPVVKSYTFLTKKKNVFTVTFTARKRSERKKPILGFYAIYSRPEGRYAVSITIPSKIISIYPPHFFKRYRERILKDDTISNQDIINVFFKNNWGFTFAVVNDEYESVYQSFESTHTDENLSFVAATSQGYCFGEYKDSVNILKTIISKEMLFDKQKPIFNELQNNYDEIQKAMFD